jgi:hypothetical protein
VDCFLMNTFWPRIFVLTNFSTRAVAVQVENLKASFEISFSLDRLKGLKLGAFKLWGNWIQLAQPHRVLNFMKKT